MVGSQSNRPADLSLIYTRNLLSLRALRIHEIETYTGETALIRLKRFRPNCSKRS